MNTCTLSSIPWKKWVEAIIILNVIVCDEWTPTVSAPSLSITPGQGMMELTHIQVGMGQQRGPTPLFFQRKYAWLGVTSISLSHLSKKVQEMWCIFWCLQQTSHEVCRWGQLRHKSFLLWPWGLQCTFGTCQYLVNLWHQSHTHHQPGVIRMFLSHIEPRKCLILGGGSADNPRYHDWQ